MAESCVTKYFPSRVVAPFVHWLRSASSDTKFVHRVPLRTWSILLLDEFPAHPNWLISQSLVAFSDLFPTIDHLVPAARGGADGEPN